MSDTTTDNNDDSLIVGELSEQALKILHSLQASSENSVTEIGRLEVRKAQLIGNINTLNQRAQEILKAEGTRLGIEDGTPWQVVDGKARIIPQGTPPGGAPQQPAQPRNKREL